MAFKGLPKPFCDSDDTVGQHVPSRHLDVKKGIDLLLLHSSKHTWPYRGMFYLPSWTNPKVIPFLYSICYVLHLGTGEIARGLATVILLQF